MTPPGTPPVPTVSPLPTFGPAALLRPLPLLSLGAALACPGAQASTFHDLTRDFAEPPPAARPWVWGHWLHGNVSRESITRGLEAMARVGVGGVTMFDVAQPGIPPGPRKYLDAGWQEMFAWEIAEARRLGLEVMSQNGPGYSGNGGPWISPELASQRIVESVVRVTGGGVFRGTLPLPPAQGGFYRDVAVLALAETEAQAAYRIDGFDPKRLVWLNYVRWMGIRSTPPEAKAPAEVCIPRARESEVLALIARGRANKEIAAALELSEATVKTHIAHILAKLDAPDRTRAVTLAIERGLLRM